MHLPSLSDPDRLPSMDTGVGALSGNRDVTCSPQQAAVSREDGDGRGDRHCPAGCAGRPAGPPSCKQQPLGVRVSLQSCQTLYTPPMPQQHGARGK